MFENWSFDLMHDCNEGSIRFFLEELFIFWMQNNTLTADEIQRKIRDFNYGILHSKNKPSLVNFDKKNLGQNASQLYLIMIHMPFIFYGVKDKIAAEWRLCERQLKIMQILYSKKIREADVLKLEKLIEEYLTELKPVLNKPLQPKHHFLTHYPSLIRKMGPPIHGWMMRFEAKHQEFTKMARATQNFQNIPKTLSERHQEGHVFSSLLVEQVVEPSKTCREFNIELSPLANIILKHFGELFKCFWK